jgi:hypothetical protein
MIMKVEPHAAELLSRAQVEFLIRYAVPYWRAFVSGPVPLGKTEPFRLEVTGMVVPTQAEALEAVEEHVRRLCNVYRIDYDEEDWHLMGIFLVNGN